MKARVKATGEIVEVEFIERKTHTNEEVYITQEGRLIEESRLDFNVEAIDYWTRLEHQYAGMAMQGILSNPESELDYKGDETLPEALAGCAAKVAHALVQKLKEKEERK